MPKTMVSGSTLRVAFLTRGSAFVLRYGLVMIILWFGIFKFTVAEAEAIEPLLANSPLTRWIYGLTDVTGASRLIGLSEIVIAILLALGPAAPRASLLGSLGAIGMFLTTLSFLLTTPGTWAWVEGVFVPAGPGGFLIKDFILLGAACSTAGDALTARAASTVP